jgi:uncharacterized protein (DUF302 family)
MGRGRASSEVIGANDERGFRRVGDRRLSRHEDELLSVRSAADAVDLRNRSRLKVSIESAGFWVLHEIDPQGLLKRGGYEIRAARQIMFFLPRFMARLLRADAAALIEAPLKFGLPELPTGDVSVRWTNPAIAFARYGNNALRDLGEELAAACDSIVEGGLGASAQAR